MGDGSITDRTQKRSINFTKETLEALDKLAAKKLTRYINAFLEQTCLSDVARVMCSKEERSSFAVSEEMIRFQVAPLLTKKKPP